MTDHQTNQSNPSSIKDIYDRLTEKEKQTLNYAFEYGLSQHIQYARGFYIGVHTQNTASLLPTMSAGAWSIGTIK